MYSNGSNGGQSYTPSQLRTVEITTRVASSLSLLGVVVIITTFCLSPRFRNPMHRLIFINAFYNIFDSAATFASRAGPNMGDDSAFCQGQAFLNQMFPLADVLWSLVMATDVYLIVFHHYDAHSLKKLEWKYVTLVTTITFIPAFTFLFLRRGDNGQRIYGSAVMWCAIRPDEPIIRIASYYIPIWVSVFVTLGLYFRIGVEIIRRRRALMSISRDSVRLDDTVLPLTTLSHNNAGVENQEVKMESDAEHITTAHATPSTSMSPHLVIPSPSTPATPNSTTHILTISSAQDSSTHIHLPRNSSLSFRQYIIMPLLFALTLFSVWVPSTVNRILPKIIPSFISPYQLIVVAGVFCSLRGFFNGVVFVLVGRGSRKRRARRYETGT